MSWRISLAASPQLASSAGFPRIPASFDARSSATQHISFEDTYCCGLPRASQIPWSGCFQTAAAQRAWLSTIGHRRRGSRWLRTVCSRIESSTDPKTSFCRWSKAPLPIRTGLAPA